ncbi:MAG: asparagine synthase (glutamine-hydrolyzing) [Candidatus Eisenbacteria bacterium]|uniref:asparagine synthase (glutamine-hydrolyzing) n=1 Tax=Eiseniibacteriota bacterium TaxID=2212470 RepID=A0A9D6QLP1_UNCEI|nr:asparagine synthase (glutamine-hydrolyzing) [Candidatus Eisenbacteria bacterium]MBI3538883.1 asparagine synthase (glutamine-hydrolyzing) [Candidatus Eisenbacteria bacterium]
MCGIAGLWAPRMDRHERIAHVTAMVERLRHRGPSGLAVWDGDEITLGIARLAIVARHSPASVLENETGSLRAVVNGEVYNHVAIVRELAARGHDLGTTLDTAVIPHLYEERGARFPMALDGMFAVALWDADARRLTLARDRAGEKPLFHARTAEGFAFASEPGALQALPWISRDPSPAALARYLAHGFIAGEDCAFAALRQLPPGHVLEVDAQAARATRYWRPWDVPSTRATPRAARGAIAAGDAALVALESAVASRVPGEVPFGIFLSGGIDSGLVATLAARVLGRAFPTFSMRIAHRGYDESALARAVATSIGAEHHELVMDAAAGAEALDAFAAEMDQPLGDPSVLPTWALARLASAHVPVVLTGEGGDELFAGYPTYLGHRHAAIAQRIPRAAATAAVALARRFRPKHHHVTIAHLIERFLATRDLPPFERHLAWFGTARPDEATALLAPSLRASLDADAPLAHVMAFERALAAAGLTRAGVPPPLVAYQLLDFELYLSGDLLTKVDRCTMAHGVESRAPFLRPALIEYALALDERDTLRGRQGKWALRRAAAGLLPPEVLARRKQGFSPPFSAWARGPLRGAVAATLAPERIARAGVLDPIAAGRVLDDHLACRTDRGRTLWTLVSLQLWAERWVLGGTPGTWAGSLARSANGAGIAAGSTDAPQPAPQPAPSEVVPAG